MAGYWLNLEDGQFSSVLDHLMAVEDDPARFRLNPQERADLLSMSRREALRMVFQKGFVRVREEFQGEGAVEIEFDRDTEEAVDAIRAFVRQKGYAEKTTLKIRNHHGRKTLWVTAKVLMASEAPQWVSY